MAEGPVEMAQHYPEESLRVKRVLEKSEEKHKERVKAALTVRALIVIPHCVIRSEEKGV